MAYDLLTVNLISQKRRLNARFYIDTDYDIYVPEDYDQHESFGFYEGDLGNAFSHACKMIEQLEQQNGQKSDSDKEQLVQDWKNYLHALYQWENVDEKQTKYLMNALFQLGMEGIVYEQIILHHQEYRAEVDHNEREDGPYHVALNFPESYERYGDSLLFHQGNPELALSFYKLTALDWSEDRKSNRNRKTLENQWTIQYRECRYYYQNVFIPRIRNKRESVAPSFFQSIFLEIQDMLRKEKERDIILEKMNGFYREYVRLSNKETDKSELRKVLFMAYRLREQGLPLALYFLEQESEDTVRLYWKAALECLRKSRDERMKVMRQYVERNSGKTGSDYSTFFKVLSMSKMMLYVEDAKKCLLAKGPGKDVAYYTSLETFSYLLPGREGDNPDTGKMSIMNVAYMNDPTEGQMLKRYLIKDKRTLNDTYQGRKDASYPYVFMKCFTTLIDDLPMWEMYGDQAKGCCIVLRRGRFLQSGYQVSIPLYRICYLRKQPSGIVLQKEDNPHIGEFAKLAECMKNIRQMFETDAEGRRWYLKITEEIQYLFKNADYHHEQELRIIYQYPHWEKEMKHTPGDCPKLYIQPNFHPDIKEIILGPKFENRADKMPYLQEQVERMCGQTQGNMPRITLSAIEYR